MTPDTATRQGRSWLPLTLVAAASVAVYANALGNGLHVDNRYLIVTNPWITSLRNLPTIFSSGVWDVDGRVSSYYRPMAYVLYSLVYAVAGTAPWAYHLLNVILHGGTAVLAFLIGRQLLGADAARPLWRSPAFLVALLFAVHPIHTEPVAWAAGIFDLSCAFFYLLAFYLVIRRGSDYRFVTVALACFGLALLSKEPAITLPAILVVYWWLGDRGHDGVRGILLRVAPWVVVAGAYLLVRSLVLGGVAPQASPVGLSPAEYVLTSIALLGRFLRAQLFPLQLNFWHVFTPVRSLWSVDAGVGLLTVGAWAALLGWALKRRALVPVVGLTLAVLPLTPVLLLRSLNQGLETAFAERYVYFSSFGVLLAAGWVIAALESKRAQLARGLTVALAALAVIAAAATVLRNPVWKSSLSLWADAAAKSPESGVAHLNYGFALITAGQMEPGRQHVARAVALSPGLVHRQMSRAIGYARSGRSNDALLAFHNVLVMDPRSSEAHYNLGVLYEERGQNDMAMSEYLAAIELNPAAANAHNNVGILYYQAGQPGEGLKHLQEAVRLQPNDPEFRANFQKATAR